MRQIGWLGSVALALALAACGHRAGGGGEDFAIEVKRAPQDAIEPFLRPDITDAQRVFPGLSVGVSRPSDHEVLYSIAAAGALSMQGSGGAMPRDKTTIRLDFEPLGKGRLTRIHATVDAAPTTWNRNGKDMVLSEDKIESELRKVVEAMASGLVKHEELDSPRSDLASLLVGVAIASSPNFRKKALALEKDPGAISSLLGGGLFGDGPMGAPADDGRGNAFGEAEDVRPVQSARGSVPEPDESFGSPDLPDPSHTGD